MKRYFLISIFLGACLMQCASMVAQDTEKKIRRSDLPDAVRKTVDAETKGATLSAVSKETEKGHVYYEASFVVKGHRRDILIDSAGTVVEVEEEVAFDDLPADIQKALETKAGKGKIIKVESVTKPGKPVTYEATVQTGGKTTEVLLRP